VAISWDESRLYVGAADGLYALDPLTGAAITGWEEPASHDCAVKSSPAVDPILAPWDGTVYFGTQCSTFVAYNPDKTEKWSYPTTGWVDSSPARFSFDTGEDLVVFGVGGIETGRVVCLNAGDGSLKWEYVGTGDTAIGGGCNSSPAIGSDGSVYVGCDDGKLWGFDGLTGELKAGFPVFVHNQPTATSTLVEGCSPTTAPAAEGGDYIFMTSHSDTGNIYVFKDDGTEVKGGTLPDGNSSPTLTADSTYLLHTGYFLGAYTVLGNLEWYAVLDDTEYDWISSSPTIGYDGVVFVLEYRGFEGSGYLYAIQGSADLFTGEGSFPKFRGDWANTGWGFLPAGP
jgi:outer membrane protein assembly factor BamB